jgi:hypothetical protein
MKDPTPLTKLRERYRLETMDGRYVCSMNHFFNRAREKAKTLSEQTGLDYRFIDVLTGETLFIVKPNRFA